MPGLLDLITDNTTYPVVAVRFTTTSDADLNDGTKYLYLAVYVNAPEPIANAGFRGRLLAGLKSALEGLGTVSDVTMTLHGESSTDVTPA